VAKGKVNSEDEFQKIAKELKAKAYVPIYLLDGAESYYIDKIVDLIEHNVLADHEKDFNQTILYGKETTWVDVLNACKQYPAFGERQVVIVKEAQGLKEIDMLESYFNKPMPTTILVLAYKNGTIDKRKKAFKAIGTVGVHFTSTPVASYELHGWITKYLSQQKINASPQVVDMLATYLGTNIQNIVNEIDKVKINVPDLSTLTADHVEKYIGANRDYTYWELTTSLLKKDKLNTFRILNYFLANDKNAPMVSVTANFQSEFSRLYIMHNAPQMQDNQLAGLFGLNPFLIRNYREYIRNYNAAQVEQALLLNYEFACKAVGINNSAEQESLLKELTTRLFYL
jgi:DNA polymerase III subunit delta